MVVFKDNPEKYDSADRFLKIQEDMKSVMKLNKRIKKMEEEVKLNTMVSIIYIVDHQLMYFTIYISVH